VTRQKLLEAALDSLAAVGYSGTSVAVVAARAGVSRGAAQHHFPTRTEAIVGLLADVYAGPLFRAALHLWVAASTEEPLRQQIVRLESHVGRQVHRTLLEVLEVDERTPGVRETVQGVLDMVRGLGLADLLTDDSTRRRGIVRQWAKILDQALADAR